MKHDTLNTTFKIMEQAFGKEKFATYLKGSIIAYTLEENIEMVKLYVDKLNDVLHDKKPTKPQTKAQDRDFKIGDHVLIGRGTPDERTGVIIRLPMDGTDCPSSYVIDLDDKDLGWTAVAEVDGVNCNNAWVASAKSMELLED